MKVKVTIDGRSTTMQFTDTWVERDVPCDFVDYAPTSFKDIERTRTLKDVWNEAVAKATKRLYGRSARWFPSHGLDGYGQVVRCNSKNGSGGPTLTGLVSIDVEEV